MAIFCGAPALAQNTPQDVAQDRPVHPALRDLCSDRPGLNTAACTVDPGHIQVELGLGDWSLDQQDGQREDRVESGDVLVRYGMSGTTEVRLAWTAYGHLRTRDTMTGEIQTISGTGDLTIAVKQNLRHPAEGKMGLAVALLPFVTVPTGHSEIGEGDWGAGMIIGSSFKINDAVSLQLSPELDAAVNDSGSGRHLSFGTAMGVQVHLSKTVKLTPEFQLMRNEDPAEHMTLSRASLSFDVQPTKMMQLDIQAVAGLNSNTPDVALSFGVTRKF